MDDCSLFKETLKYLKKYRIKPRKRLGQNFLVDCGVLEKLLRYMNPDTSDVVLEIGAGIGTVTEKLAEKCRRIIAVEIDKKLFNILEKRFHDVGNVKLLNIDFLKMELPRVNKIFSNIPYSFSSDILIKLLKENKFDKAILVFQKEFVERLMAEPGTKKYGRLSVFVKIFSNIEAKDIIPRYAFYPVPEVDSRILIVYPKEVNLQDIQLFESFTSLIFSQRRRTLYSALKHIKPDLIEILKSKGGIYLKKRVYKLTPEDILYLFDLFKPFL